MNDPRKSISSRKNTYIKVKRGFSMGNKVYSYFGLKFIRTLWLALVSLFNTKAQAVTANSQKFFCFQNISMK